MSFIKKIARPLFAFIFLAALIKFGPFKIDQLKYIFAQPKVLFLGTSLFGIQYILLSLRWKSFFNFKSTVSFYKSFQLTLVGQYFSFFIPGGVGGDIVKAIELSRSQQTSKSEALSTVIADRVLGLFAMVLMSTVFLLLELVQNYNLTYLKFFSFSSILLVMIIIGLLAAPFFTKLLNAHFSQKIHPLLVKLNNLITSFNLTFDSFRNVKLMFKTVFMCFLIQLISIYFMYFIINSLQPSAISFLVFFALSCFGFLASAIPITPAGVGVGQTAFYVLFNQITPTLGEASVTAISALQIFQLLYALVGGLFFSINLNKKSKLQEGTL